MHINFNYATYIFLWKKSSDKKLFFQLIADIELVKMRKKTKKFYFSYFFQGDSNNELI